MQQSKPLMMEPDLLLRYYLARGPGKRRLGQRLLRLHRAGYHSPDTGFLELEIRGKRLIVTVR